MTGKQWVQVNPSCLLAYLGIRGYANPKSSNDGEASKNALPILTYFDIFKNYYANTQEENFYVIGASPKLTVAIGGIDITDPDNITTTEGAITGGSKVTILPTTLKENEIKLFSLLNVFIPCLCENCISSIHNCIYLRLCA